MKNVLGWIGWGLSAIAATVLTVILIPTFVAVVLILVGGVFGLLFFIWAIGTPFTIYRSGVPIGYVRWTKFTRI